MNFVKKTIDFFMGYLNAENHEIAEGTEKRME
jgi:hypothetical protein